MIRQSIVQTLKTTTFTVPVRRTISTTAIRMAEGDAGAPRSGGAAQGYVVSLQYAHQWPFSCNLSLPLLAICLGCSWQIVIRKELHSIESRALCLCVYADFCFSFRDAFTKREQASEDYYMRQKEIEKLEAMRKRIAEHQKHLEEMDKTMYVPTPLLPYISFFTGIRKSLIVSSPSWRASAAACTMIQEAVLGPAANFESPEARRSIPTRTRLAVRTKRGLEKWASHVTFLESGMKLCLRLFCPLSYPLCQTVYR